MPRDYTPKYSPTEDMDRALAESIIYQGADAMLSFTRGDLQPGLLGARVDFLAENLPKQALKEKKWARGGVWRGRVDEAFAFLGLAPIVDLKPAPKPEPVKPAPEPFVSSGVWERQMDAGYTGPRANQYVRRTQAPEPLVCSDEESPFGAAFQRAKQKQRRKK